jgi:hypothetical protein
MKSFLIELDFEQDRCECFVQKIGCRTEELFLLSFKNTSLIQRFSGKRLLLSAKNRKDSSVQMFWNAIRQQGI